MSTQPRHIHDCNRCEFLGHHDIRGRQIDLYFCEQGGDNLPTVIARYGSEGDNYSSGLGFGQHIPELGEAEKRARERGLLNPN